MIPVFDYRATLPEIQDEITSAFRRVLHSGRLILGPETEAFEKEFSVFTGAPHCVGVSSGTTALHLTLLGLGIGPSEEVITTANTCAPTAAAIRLAGAVPVFVDVEADTLLMDPYRLRAALSPRTKCIIPVHLWGAAADMDAITAIASERAVPVIEDCAQAHGTTLGRRHVGTFGAAGCFSFYPTKNIGAFGDAGAVVTSEPGFADRLRKLRVYGYDSAGIAGMDGMNARISELQAAILRIKIRKYPEWLARRRRFAEMYAERLDRRHIEIPATTPGCAHTYHQFVVLCDHRPALRKWLDVHGIGSGVHYPVPLHRMAPYAACVPAGSRLRNTELSCERVLSLPVHEGLSEADIARIIEVINSFEPLDR